MDVRILPPPEGQDVLTELLRDGARRLLAEAIEAEVPPSGSATTPTSATRPCGPRRLVGSNC